MRSFLVTFVFSCICFMSHAQHLMINQDAGKLYILHEVLAKQNWYTIGRMYNISPKEIAPFNGTGIDKILSIGQELKIPLVENNFAQSGQPEENEVFVPLYHTIKEKEGLFRISAQYNKVDQKSLKIWNDLKNSDLGKGKDIIVGFLRVKKSVSPLAVDGLTRIPDPANGKQEAIVSKKESNTPKTDSPNTTTTQNTDSKTAISKESIDQSAASKNRNVIPERPDEMAKKKESSIINSNTNAVSNQNSSVLEIQSAPGTEGLFASAYDEQTRNGRTNSVNGTASIFKSTSGWKDGKYYVLMNNVTPGTIVKILSTSNGKVVYAKVLGELPPIKENEGLTLRISNAAAGQLLMNDSKFEVMVHY